ncbi:MAG: ABC transporter permease [Bacilli bacterium]|nr:ABC transporter permease [Bacilli bacterium]
MVKYSIKRIILALVTAFIILSLTFILVKSIPLVVEAGSTTASKFAFFEKQVSLGYVISTNTPRSDLGPLLFSYKPQGAAMIYYYERPVLDQYVNWLGNIFRGDWGTSTAIKMNVGAMDIILERLPTSLIINIISVVISVPLGILLGIVAGLRKNTWVDHLISTLVMIFISIPSFVIITYMIYFFAFKAGALPMMWPNSNAPIEKRLLGLIIPVVSLSFGSICGYTRFVRAELCEVMSSEYLLLARTKGLTKNQAITRHALRNAFVPILPSILAEFIGVFGGSMILEGLYNIPGIGSLYIDALNKKDYNVLMVDMAVFTIIGLLAGIVLDLSYGFIDPRIRMGEK